ncbi:MAG: hypothetical protein PVF83_16435 [Anaerolineales bacterium]|jgi:hypothetical protein
MIAQNAIPDVFILDLDRKEKHLVILSETHHLLRRFGQVEFVHMIKRKETDFSLREIADEIWSVVVGEVSFTLEDKREDSPSENQSMQVELTGSHPQAVLIPFGVAYRIKTIKDSQLIRITTHADGIHEDD